ncbi:MAG: tetratricopeptide repeat protein [Polyangia bacterium]|jgi:tetratricopeptide (TPR) repeat protein|nr:tetratricopeptide repeat protein [Polyangia bacterium]
MVSISPVGLSLARAHREDLDTVGPQTVEWEPIGGEDTSTKGAFIPVETKGLDTSIGEGKDAGPVVGPGCKNDALHEAERLLSLGRLNEALQGYDAHLALEPSDFKVRLRRIEILSCSPRSIPEARRLARRLLVEVSPSLDGASSTLRSEDSQGSPDGAVVAVARARIYPLDGFQGLTRQRESDGRGVDWQAEARDLAVSALSILAATAEELGEPVEAASRYSILSFLAERAGDLSGAMLASLACGRVLAGPEPDQAIAWYERALGLEPGQSGALAALIGLYRRQGRISDLLLLVRRNLAHTTDRRERLRGHLTLGSLYISPLGDAFRARAEFERAVRLDDVNLAAWDGLAEAHRLSGDHHRERRALERVIALSVDRGDIEAVSRVKLRMARSWAEAGELARALGVTGALLAAQPDDLEALELHGDVSARAGLWDGAAETLERLLAQESLTPNHRSDVALKLARIRLDGLGDAAGARIFLDASLASGDRVDSLRFALQLAEAEAFPGERAELLGRLAELRSMEAERAGLEGRREEQVAAEEEAVNARLERAAILGGDLGRVDEALSALEPILERISRPEIQTRPQGIREALRLKVRLLRACGRNEEGNEAIARLGDWILGIGASPEEVEVLHLVDYAETVSRRFEGSESKAQNEGRAEALRLLRRLHALVPQDSRPLVALTSLLGGVEEQAEREGLLERLASLTERKGDAGRQAAALRELGRLRRMQGRSEESLDALRAAAILAPGDSELQAELGEAAFAAEAWDEAETAFRAAVAGIPAPAESVRIVLRLGQIALRKGMAEEGLRLLKESLVAEPRPVGELAKECHQALIESLSVSGFWREAARALEAMATDERTLEPQSSRTAALFAAAEILRRRVGDAIEAERLYRVVITFDPAHLGALNGLTVLLSGAEQWDHVAVLLERKASLLAKSGEAIPILYELATLYSVRLQRPQASRAVFERILEMDPAHLEALRFVAEDALACGDLGVASRHYRRMLEYLGRDDIEKPETALREMIAIHRSLASIAHRSGDPDASIFELSEIIRLAPTDSMALQTLDELLASQGRWRDLTDVLRRRADQSDHTGEAVSLLMRLATVLGERLGRLDEAVAVCREVLRREPDRLDALALQASYMKQTGGDAVERRRVLERLIVGMRAAREMAGGLAAHDEIQLPTHRNLCLELGLLLRRELGEPQAGARYLREALESGCNEATLHRELCSIAREERQKDELALSLYRLSEACDDGDEREAVLLELAEVRLCDLTDAAGAMQVLDSLHQNERTELALSLEARCLEAQMQWEEALCAYRVLEQRAQNRNEKASEIFALERMLEISLRKMEDLSAAREIAKRLLDVSPGHMAALESMDSVARRLRLVPDLMWAIERQAEVLGEGSDGVEAAAGKLCEAAQLLLYVGDIDGANSRASEALGRHPDSLEARLLLAQTQSARKEFHEASQTLNGLARRLSARKPQDEEQRGYLGGVLLEIAALCVDALADGELARNAWRSASALLSGPALIGALQGWAECAASDERWGEAAEVLERLGSMRSETLDSLKLSEAYERLGRLDEALRVLRDAPAPRGHVDELDELSSRLRDSIRNLLGAMGRYGELARTLEEDALGSRELPRRQSLFLQAAEHYLNRAGEGGRAERCLMAVLQEEPLCVEAALKLLARADRSERKAEVEAVLLLSAQASVERVSKRLREGEPAAEMMDVLSRIANHRLEINPEDEHAQGWLGVLLSAAPDRLSDLERHGEYLLKKGEAERYLSHLEAAIFSPAIDPKERQKLLMRAARLCVHTIDDPERALKLLRREANAGSMPMSGDALALEAELSERLGHLEQAEDALLRLAKESASPEQLLLRAVQIADRRGDQASAIRTLWRLISNLERPDDKWSRLVEVERRCREANDLDGRACALEELARLTKNDQERSVTLVELGQLRMELNQWDAATSALLDAVRAAPGLVMAQQKLGRVAWHRSDLEAARMAFATAHDLLPESAREERASVSMERSTVEEELNGDVALARRFARQAAEETQMADYKAQALRRAARLSAVTDEKSQEEEALRAILDLGVADAAELRRLAVLCEVRGAFAEALKVYEHLRAREPQSPEIRQQLAAALLATGQRRRAVDELAAAAERYAARGDTSLAAEAYVEAASRRLAEDAADPEARSLLLAAVSVEPRNDAAFCQSMRLYRQGRDYEGVIEVLKRRLPVLDVSGQQAAFREMASVARDDLEDSDRAASYLALGLASCGDDPSMLAALVEYHAARSEWPMVNDYGRRLDSLGGPTQERAFEVNCCLADGAISVGEKGVARTCLRRAISVRPKDLLTRKRLEDLLLEEEAFSEVLDLWKERAAQEEGADRAVTLTKAAEICEQRLNDPGLAESLFKESIDASPGDDSIRWRLVALLRRHERWRPLFEELKTVHRTTVGPRRAEVADELATIAELKLEEPETALFYRRVALRDAPADVGRLRALVDFLAASRNWGELVAVLEEALHTMVLDADSASGFYSLLGRAYMEKLERPDLALATFERARARGALTIRSGERLAELMESSGRFAELASLLDELADRQEDSAARQRLVVKRARVLADHLGQPGEAAGNILALFRLSPRKRRKLGALARKLFVQARMMEDALRVLEEELNTAEGHEQIELLMEQGSLYEGPMQRQADALVSYRRVVELSPSHPLAHYRLAFLLFGMGECEDALWHVASALKADSQEIRASAHKLAANICSQLDRDDDAVSHLEASLRHEPTDLEAIRELGHLYTASGNWDRLAENMGRELALTVDPSSRARLWFRRGLVYRDMLDRSGEALRCLKEAAGADPKNAEVMAALREFALERGDWETSLDLLDRQLQLEGTTDARAQLLLRRADLLELHFGRMEEAAESLDEALSIKGGNDDVLLRRLIRLNIHRKDWSRAARLEVQLCNHIKDEAARCDTMLRAAALHLKAEDRDAAWLAAMSVLDGGGVEKALIAAERLAEMAVSKEKQAELLNALDKRRIGMEEPLAQSRALRMMLRLADALGAEARGDEFAEELCRIDPSDRVAFAHHRRRLEIEERFDELERLIVHRLSIASREEELDLLTALALLQRDRLAKLEEAANTLDRLLVLRPDDLAALDARADIAFRQGEFKVAQELYGRMGTHKGSLDDGEHSFRRGRIAEALGDDGAAVAEYSIAVASRPDHQGALEAITRLHLLHGRVGEAMPCLATLCEILPPSERALACGLQLARLRLAQGQGDQAESGLLALAKQYPDKRTVLERLAETQRALGRWDALAGTLAELAVRAPGPERRARLLYEEGEVFLYHLHEPEAAARLFLQAADLAPHDPDILRRLADHYSQLGRWEDSRRAFAQLLEVLSVEDQTGADPRIGSAMLGLALTALLCGGDSAKESPALIRQPLVGEVEPTQAIEVLAPIAQGLYVSDMDSSGIRRIFDLADSALGRACLPRWTEAAERLADERPADLGIRRLLIRLISRVGEAGVADLHEAATRFLDPASAAGFTVPNETTRAAPQRSVAIFGPAVTEAARVPLRTLLSGLHPQLGRIAKPLDPSALGPEVDELRSPELVTLCDELRGALEAGPVGVVFARDPRRPVELIYSHPPVMLLDPDIMVLPTGQVRFLIGRALELVRSGALLLESEPIERAQEILDSVAMLFGIPLPEGARAESSMVSRLQDRGFCPDLFDNQTMEALQVAFFNHYRAPVALEGYLVEERRVANRVGLLVGGDLCAGLEALAQEAHARSGSDAPLDAAARRRLVHMESEMREMLRFGTSALFNQLRRQRTTLPRM